ncbi:caffeic acid 3-O-methyltransferase-like [Henckelia pumila]|uniref:caffeic acid 3-O-methyltransferase-like n=1 Tax=Henckelia pumila TaxID=405737 RepID=UPI003C6EA0D2
MACNSGILQTVLKAAIQLDLFGIISKSGDGAHMSAFEIASKLPTRDVQGATRVLESMLRVLATHSIFLSSTDRDVPTTSHDRVCYGLAPAGKFFVADANGMSLAHFLALQIQLKWIEAMREGLKDAVLEGSNLFENFHGQSWVEHMASNPKSNDIFNSAMATLSTLTMRKIVEKYNGFEGLSTLVNVGGGNGSTLDLIISKYPHVRGINLDLPHVVKNAPAYKGVEHIGGDMFLQVPKGDAIMLKAVLHNWEDEECLKLLEKCYKALADKGKVIVVENILPQKPRTDFYSKYVSQLDINMWAIPGGKERTKSEFEALSVHVGFADFKVVCCAYGHWVMELIK